MHPHAKVDIDSGRETPKNHGLMIAPCAVEPENERAQYTVLLFTMFCAAPINDGGSSLSSCMCV